MRLQIVLVVGLLVLVMSCSAKKSQTAQCPSIEINYMQATLNEWGNAVGMFSIRNNGPSAIELPLVSGTGSAIHGAYASTEQRLFMAGAAWQPFNPLLDEMMAPKRTMRVEPGQQGTFNFDVNGLLLEGRGEFGMEYSVVIKDMAGCKFRSAPFKP